MTTKKPYTIVISAKDRYRVQRAKLNMTDVITSSMERYLSGERVLRDDIMVKTGMYASSEVKDAFKALAEKHHISLNRAIQIALRDELDSLGL